jgi:Cd2+/Zn2+-exporting ATPase
MKSEKPLVSGLDAPTGDCCGSTHAAHAPMLTAAGAAGRIFRIATMDCSAEESDIRRALEPIAGIRSLGFQLGARTLRIDASEEAYATALDAIRKAGFDPQPAQTGASAQADGHHHAGHDHSHEGSFGSGATRLAAALVLAVAAEAVSFFAPELLAWKVAGMAVAAAAIGLAGLDTYKKGMAALQRGKLNINALMSVAVTGAFLIGQWPEAAMVMALYAIAELIEARAVDRARNAIKGLLDMAPEAGTDARRRRRLDKHAGGRRPAASPGAHTPRRARTTGRPGDPGQQRYQPGAHHRREYSGRQGARRRRLCRHHQ